MKATVETNGVCYGDRAITEDLIAELFKAGPPPGNSAIRDPDRGIVLRHWGRNQGSFAGKVTIMHRGPAHDNEVAFNISHLRPYGQRLPWEQIRRALRRLDEE